MNEKGLFVIRVTNKEPPVETGGVPKQNCLYESYFN